VQNSLRGVATDALNQKVITGDSKGILKFWRFKSKELVGKLGKYLLLMMLLLIDTTHHAQAITITPATTEAVDMVEVADAGTGMSPTLGVEAMEASTEGAVEAVEAVVAVAATSMLGEEASDS
jgi:hypothetical protein